MSTHALGQAGEAADVAEHDRQQPDLAAEHQLFRMPRQLLDIMRRHVAREGPTDLALPPFGLAIAEQRREQVDRGQHRDRVDRVDQQLGVAEGEP